jgi:hypothetical protein
MTPPTTTAVIPTVVATTTTAPATTTTTIPTTTTVLETTTTLPAIPPVVTPEQAVEIATNPEVLASATKEEAIEVFKALQIDDLSDGQVAELVAAVQSAPKTVRQAFEKEINIFGGGGLDTYVPVGSKVPVKQRRALIVIGMALVSVPTPKRRK